MLVCLNVDAPQAFQLAVKSFTADSTKLASHRPRMEQAA